MNDTYSEKFKEYVYKQFEIFNGYETVYRFENGYGASVIHHDYSYDLEVAVVIFTKDGDWGITYDTSLTNDVIGYVEDLDSVLKDIKDLKC